MNIHIGWPQGIYLSLLLIGLILSAKDHGKPRPNGNVWIQVTATIIVLPLLIWGGFFR